MSFSWRFPRKEWARLRWEFPRENWARLTSGKMTLYLSSDANAGFVDCARLIKEMDSKWEWGPDTVHMGIRKGMQEDNRKACWVRGNWRIAGSCWNVECGYVPKEALAFLHHCSPDRVLRLIREWNGIHGVNGDSWDYGIHFFESILRTLATFRKRGGEWLRAISDAALQEFSAEQRKRMRFYLPASINLYAFCQWLPFPMRSDPPGLPDYLLRYRRSKTEYLKLIANGWPRLSDEQRRLSPPKIVNEHWESLCDSFYPQAKSPPLARQALFAGVSPRDYQGIEERWLKSLCVPRAFSYLDVNLEGLTARFLDRDDPIGLFLGHHTNCCQYPGACADSSAWNGQEDPAGGFLVVKNEKGEVLAQSWTWRNEAGVCFDSIESKGLIDEQKGRVSRIYLEVARMLVEAGFKEVRCGPHDKLLDGKISPFGPRCCPMKFVPPRANIAVPRRMMRLKPPFDKKTYSDARWSQWTLAKGE